MFSEILTFLSKLALEDWQKVSTFNFWNYSHQPKIYYFHLYFTFFCWCFLSFETFKIVLKRLMTFYDRPSHIIETLEALHSIPFISKKKTIKRVTITSYISILIVMFVHFMYTLCTFFICVNVMRLYTNSITLTCVA